MPRMRLLRGQSKRSLAIDRSKKNTNLVRDTKKFKNPRRQDLTGYDTKAMGKKKKAVKKKVTKRKTVKKKRR